MTQIRRDDTEDKTLLRGTPKPIEETDMQKQERLHRLIQEAWAIYDYSQELLKQLEAK